MNAAALVRGRPSREGGRGHERGVEKPTRGRLGEKRLHRSLL